MPLSPVSIPFHALGLCFPISEATTESLPPPGPQPPAPSRPGACVPPQGHQRSEQAGMILLTPTNPPTALLFATTTIPLVTILAAWLPLYTGSKTSGALGLLLKYL